MNLKDEICSFYYSYKTLSKEEFEVRIVGARIILKEVLKFILVRALTET